MGDNPHEAMAGMDKDAYAKRYRELRLRRASLTPEQRELARQQRSLVLSRIADEKRSARRFAEIQPTRPDVVVPPRA